jgi:thiopurine S-methyltransferase
MDRAYWMGRWSRGETGWHQAEPEPALVRFFGTLASTRVFVPLCGKSLDVAWLSARHSVLGVEWSELACRAFFEERQITPRESKQGPFLRFEGGNVVLLCGDFFALEPGDLEGVGAVYDRAALIALPRAERERYAQHLLGLVSTARDLAFLQLCLERSPSDENGPPFSVDEAELRAHYGSAFRLEFIESEDVPLAQREGQPISVMRQRAYRLIRL